MKLSYWPKVIGNLALKLRLASKMSQQELAHKLKITAGVKQLLNKEYVPQKYEILVRIADLFR